MVILRLDAILTPNSSIMVHHGLTYSIIVKGPITFRNRKKSHIALCLTSWQPQVSLAWKRNQLFGLAAGVLY